MKSLLLRSSFLFFLLCPGVLLAQATPVPTPSSAAEESEKVPVELEWETIPGAKLYELEFRSQAGKVLSVFKSTNPIFRFRFKVGQYRVRSRVADARKVYGEWSELQEFTVQPKPVKMSEKPVSTKGVIDPKTLTTEVAWQWQPAAGAKQFRVKVFNEKNEVVRDEVVSGLSYKTQLGAGEYTTVLTSVGADGIESEPVTLAGKVKVEKVQLAAPVIAFEEVPDPANPKHKVTRLPRTKAGPALRWKEPSVVAETVGTLEYRYFFGEEWIPVDRFTSKGASEVILSKATRPGRYRINTWAEAEGLKKSEITSYEFVVKPTEY